MKNFDYNPTYHPYNAYSNHSYNHSSSSSSSSNNNNINNNNNNNTNAYQAYQQQQQQRHQQLQRHYQHNHHQQQQQQPEQLQQQLQQPPTYHSYQQRQQHQQQHPHNAPLTTTSSASITVSHSTNTNNTTNTNNSLNMQASSTYANFIANFNHNQQQNINQINNNNNNYTANNSNNNAIHNYQQQHAAAAVHQQYQNQQQEVTSWSAAPPIAVDKFTMDACEIANFLANELLMQQLVSVDGIQSGVPTLTTSTLTPTTLRSIEETFIQLTSEPINAPYQAGFIPPPLAPFPSLTSTSIAVIAATPTTTYNASSIHDYNDALDTESEDSQGSWNDATHLNEEHSLATTDTSSAATDSLSFQNGINGMGNNSLATSLTSSTNDFTEVNIGFAAAAKAAAAATSKGGNLNNKNTSNSATPTTTRRNQGGRRPAKSFNISPEEEEKRRVRRERNKLAAARCRKRRVDQTNELLDEVAILEQKREVLQKDIENLNSTKQELEYILDAHRPTCQKVRQDMLTVSTFGGLIAPNRSSNSAITGLDPALSTTGRSISPLDLKPDILADDNMLDDVHIKHEPIDNALDSSSSLDGPPSPKRILLTRSNPMIPPPLPNVATLSPSLAAASASLNTPIVTTAPVSFGSFSNCNATLNALNALNSLHRLPNGSKQRPNTLPTMPRNLAQNMGLNVVGKPPTDINGVAIQTPSTGMFNFDSLMDGGTGLTPVSGPLVPTCSSQNKHPLELITPTSEPSKLVSL